MNRMEFEEHLEKTRQMLDTLPEGAYEAELRLQVLALQHLSKGSPVSPKELANVWEMPLDQVNQIFEQAKAQGTLQIDNAGNMVGATISLIPTNHKVQIHDVELYAWCAYDAVFAPGVIGKKAEIESVDPLSKETIKITISPEGEIVSDPSGVVVTVVGLETDSRGGVDSPRCSQMHFFVSEENAQKWSSDYAGVSIMAVEQLYEMANVFQIEPARRMGLVD